MALIGNGGVALRTSLIERCITELCRRIAVDVVSFGRLTAHQRQTRNGNTARVIKDACRILLWCDRLEGGLSDGRILVDCAHLLIEILTLLGDPLVLLGW